MISQWEMVFRLLLSALIGGLVGMEREANNRPAGLRTHVLVTLGSSLIMMISMYGFEGMGSGGRGGDPARLAAQVVSGIGFLGAGTIMTKGNDIRGLTTAASIWVCGGIGLAIGNGYYLGGVSTGVIVLLTLTSLGLVEKKLFKKKFRILSIHCEEKPGKLGEIGQVCGKHHITIKDIKILSDIQENDSVDDRATVIDIQLAVKLPRSFSNEGFFRDILKLPGIDYVVWEDGQTIAQVN